MDLLTESVDEFQKLMSRITTPRVVVDNETNPTETIIKVDSARKHGILIDAVQILTDLNLSIKKAYISSDGRWFMDVYHVTDQNGDKLTDGRLISVVEQSLEKIECKRTGELNGLTALELAGADRVGLLSEVFAVLKDLNCNVVEGKLWTHNGRIASRIHINDAKTDSPIGDCRRISSIEGCLRTILNVDGGLGSPTASVSISTVHMERRMHQMMYADRDYDRMGTYDECPAVTVQNWAERGYSVVNVQCKDRTRLLFDVVCTLTDMGYVVHHATIDTAADVASMEFCTRHVDGGPISSEAERERVVSCLRAAIMRRGSKGVRLELLAGDRGSLLADVTRTFRENGLNVTRAEISTVEKTAHDVFYVTDARGDDVDAKTIEAVRDKIGVKCLQVKELPPMTYHGKEEAAGVAGAMLLSLGSLVRRNLYHLGFVKSHS